MFPALRMLRVLFLGHNKIRNLGDAAFRNMSMNRVGLAHNLIQDLQRSTFTGRDYLSGTLPTRGGRVVSGTRHAGWGGPFFNFTSHLV